MMSILAGLAMVSSVALIRLERAIRRHRYSAVATAADLPTVSVCIPARNEMHAMTECLERVLASDYPKLEIIVLDDSSVDDTSMLIKSFAHAGVRFVEGYPLPDGWLGKNNALQGLLEEASGRYILFLDVDTILKPTSITQLVSWLMAHKLQLVSVMPRREDGLRASVFLGTLRYFWVLFVGNAKNPAVSSTAWLIARDTLQNLGGFMSVKDHTQPESAIARNLGITDGSQLVISTKTLGVGYEKKWSSQVETSIRLLMPLLGTNLGAIMTALLLTCMGVVPFVTLVVFAVQTFTLGVYFACLVIVLITLLSLRYFHVAWQYGWWLGAIHWPYVVIQEAVLIVMSCVMYRRHRVTWKGRPISNRLGR